MSLALKPMTPDEFLAWEADQELKWEFDGLQPIAMTGGTRSHSVIQRNLLTALTIRLRDGVCQPYGSDLKVQTGRSYRYPDAVISCTPFADSETIVADPVIVFEILSASTSLIDRTSKLAEYQSVGSVRRVVLIEQDRVFATVISRATDSWTIALINDGGSLELPEGAFTVALSELYGGLALSADPER
ncbi:MAG: Uma2 family endonuclease [Gemmatimonadaceae bacterium]|nr:Uma2 family endonuclease [Acetobacteraceae bacterium]